MKRIDFVYELLQKEKKSFKDIVNELVKSCNFNMSDMGQLYSDLSMDNRFIVLDGNIWDLKDRYKFEQYHSNVDIIDDENEYMDNGENEENFEEEEDSDKKDRLERKINKINNQEVSDEDLFDDSEE